jgi:putative transposase
LTVKPLFIELGSPWENGYVESFNGKMRDELLNGEIFYSLKVAEILLEQWRLEDKPRRPRSALGYKPPAPKTVIEQPGLQSQPLSLSLKVVQSLGSGHETRLALVRC